MGKGGTVVNPTVQNKVNILDPKKAILVSGAVPPRPRPQSRPPVQAAVLPKKRETVSPQLVRYHLTGAGWKTVIGFKSDTNTQPIYVVKPSSVHTLVLSSPTQTLGPCVVKLYVTTNEETQVCTVNVDREVEGIFAVTPQAQEWNGEPQIPKGSAVSVHSDVDLDVELYLE